ncbi:MAG: thiamine pyrophosphate-binding protein, partial [Dehalococcoidia bacterium]|nr:thiamine pyrophosphate-binding protein [Dehalococcoidia bacterium]
VLLTGSGVIWSGASDQLREFVDTVGIPLFTTPQGRGVIPEDHPLCLPSARNFALRNADVILVVGTRLNFVFTFGRAPRFDPAVKVIQVDIQPEYISHNRPVDVGIAGDAKMVLGQLTQEARGKISGWAESPWLSKLKDMESQHQAKSKPLLESDQVPIHTARLCKEVRDFIPRDAVLAVDGNEILTWARQIINTYVPGHRMNCGPFGCLGVAVPFGIGAKLGKPGAPVFVLSGDGSFGFNGMEMDTAIRHKIPVVVIISNNGSWASMSHDENVPGKYLGHQRYDLMVSAFGGYGELVEHPEDIRPALERAVASGKPACLNVITDPYVKSHQSGLLHYEA